jgi:hypothetical protein
MRYRSNSHYNEYFFYLGIYRTHNEVLDVIYDFGLSSPGLISELNFDNYSEILIPQKIPDIKIFPSTQRIYDPNLFEDLISGKLGDVKLICKDGEIYGSKLLLASQSPYFSNYFSFQRNIGKDTDQIELSFSTKDIRKYLLYCISGSIANKYLTEDHDLGDLFEMGKYFMNELFIQHIYQEMIVNIDTDLYINCKEKLELYHNMVTYL